MPRASDLIRVAVSQLGVKEDPPQSNRVRYNTWFYGKEVSGRDYAWCMAFAQWCAAQAGVELPLRTASCGTLMRAAQSAGQWVTGGYRPGDIVIYDFPGGAATDHCGIVQLVAGDEVVAIEGNTGASSDADGGQVQRRTRYRRNIVGAVRPKYEPEEVEEVRYDSVSECPEWARETIQKLLDKGYLSGDGTGLDLSHDMVRLLVIQDRAGVFGG